MLFLLLFLFFLQQFLLLCNELPVLIFFLLFNCFLLLSLLIFLLLNLSLLLVSEHFLVFLWQALLILNVCEFLRLFLSKFLVINTLLEHHLLKLCLVGFSQITFRWLSDLCFFWVVFTRDQPKSVKDGISSWSATLWTVLGWFRGLCFFWVVFVTSDRLSSVNYGIGSWCSTLWTILLNNLLWNSWDRFLQKRFSGGRGDSLCNALVVIEFWLFNAHILDFIHAEDFGILARGQ